MTTGREKCVLREILILEGAVLSLSGLFLSAQGGDLPFHLHDQRRQLFLALRLGLGVDVPGHPFAVDLRGVATLPEVVVELYHAIRPESFTDWDGFCSCTSLNQDSFPPGDRGHKRKNTMPMRES